MNSYKEWSFRYNQSSNGVRNSEMTFSEAGGVGVLGIVQELDGSSFILKTHLIGWVQ